MPEIGPDSDRIDAWLAGTLAADESQELERELESIAPESERVLPADALLLDLDQHRNPDQGRALSNLIAQVKTLSGDVLPTPDPDSWREVLTSSEHPDALGRLGDYEVLGLIARGGMATVLEAFDPQLDRTVALKVLPPELAANATARARFLREARAAAKLEHENILPIHAVQEDARTAFYAMRYVPTGSLQDALDRDETFDLPRLKAIARGVASALDAAHTAGLIHRDIKPGNILLGDGGTQVWVCDFGIARSTEDPSLTYSGLIAGTPQYMSPEQAAGKELDGRSDLFSLGAVLYRCATGEPAFAGTTTRSILKSLAEAEAKPTARLRPDLPGWFERLLAKLLAKDPRQRPQDAASVVRALDHEHCRRPEWRRRRRLRLIALASSVLLGVALLQVPAVRQIASRALAHVTDRPLLIEGRFGAFENLHDAVGAARDGDTISVRGPATLIVDQLMIPPGKSLAIIASDPAQPPILTTRTPGVTGLVSRSTLELRGLDFRIKATNKAIGILSLRGPDTRLIGCRFSEATGDIRLDASVPRVIELIDGGNLTLEKCEIDVPDRVAITLLSNARRMPSETPLSRLRVRETNVRAKYLFHSRDEAASDRQRLDIVLENSRFSGGALFKQNPDAPIPDLSITAHASAFSSSRDLIWIQTQDAVTTLDRFRWRGTGNTFPSGNANLRIFSHHGQSLKPVTIPLRSFDPTTGQRFPGQAVGEVEIEGMDRRFPGLKEAFADAPDGATLILHGRLGMAETVSSPVGRSFTMRSAPNERAVIAALDPRAPVLILNGPATVSGLDFERHGTGEQARAILDINARGGEAVVEDCRFQSRPEGPRATGHRALSLTDAKLASVQRCEFHTPKGIGVFIVSVDARRGSTEVRDCLFTGASAFQVRSENQTSEAVLSATRCVVVSDHLLVGDPVAPPRPLSLSVADCIIDIGDCLFHLPDLTPERIPTDLHWSGDRNHYREGMKILRSSRAWSPEHFEPYALADFSALRTLAPQTHDMEATFGNPFFRQKLASPMSPGELKRALDSALESPAVETLDARIAAPTDR